jgi:single-stranded DNA-specific DHH superfamily exonuclease
VSAAIAADIVPMTGENRVLAFFGLQVINSNPRPGIKAIIHQIKKKVLDITDVVFYYRTQNKRCRTYQTRQSCGRIVNRI